MKRLHLRRALACLAALAQTPPRRLTCPPPQRGLPHDFKVTSVDRRHQATSTPARRSSSSTATFRTAASLPRAALPGQEGRLALGLLAPRTSPRRTRPTSERREAAAVSCTADYTGIPHDFGNGGASLLSLENGVATSSSISDALAGRLPGGDRLQLPARFGQLHASVQPAGARRPTRGRPANIDLKLQRGRGNLSSTSRRGRATSTSASATSTSAAPATRAANGTSFGFGNVVETPEPDALHHAGLRRERLAQGRLGRRARRRSTSTTSRTSTTTSPSTTRSVSPTRGIRTPTRHPSTSTRTAPCSAAWPSIPTTRPSPSRSARR